MSKCELIELKDLSVHDPIELAAPGPRVAPSQASHFHIVRLVGDTVSIEAASGDAGAGHDFQPYGHTHLSWCDLCGEFIWGLYKQALRCTNCSYTCHQRCRPFIQLDCSADRGLPAGQPDPVEMDTNVDEQTDWRKQELSVGEVHQKVKEYNAQINSNLYMVVNKDGSYTGFIKVHFQLVRPITLPPSRSPTQEEREYSRRLTRRTSFYLPKDSAKHLHISSQTRVREVIEALLNKFTVVDNPAKFALFERADRQNHGPSEKVLSLVLKENETGDVNWDAFSFPELCNFLRILQREEEEHVRQIVRRYARTRDMVKQAMARITAPA
ncbi:ras association domain-containing protein 1 isoform X3 [Hippocampus zosterae]|uniref:ras association domain-containing protein 1 isoform X3 n=1 Tax=Hippocampus zosterae TaxID=109293 RepID=UPI00223D511C|nr:ras association domain-containing protein 1 isoform X3 [Hippocampus zosterae]